MPWRRSPLHVPQLGPDARRGILFKLAVCQAGGLRSCFQRFFRYAAEILQLLDLVVSASPPERQRHLLL